MTTMDDADPVLIDHPIGSRGRLSIRLAAAELRLVATDGDRILVRTPNGAALPDRVVVEPTDGGLTIREKEILGLTFSLGRKVVQLQIDVPAMTEVGIDAASGWLDGQGLRGEQHYRLVSAESRLRDGAGRIELSTVSGDATIELADTAELAIKSVSGDVAVRGGRLDGLRIGTTSGDVWIESPLVGRTGNAIETLSGDVSIGATSGIRVEARTVSGDLMSDLPNRSEGRMGRRTLIVGDGSIELGFRSVSGDLRIRDAASHRAPDRPFVHGGPSSAAMPQMPAMPEMPRMPMMPAPVGGRVESAPPAAPVAGDDPLGSERMTILRALEHGEMDVATAMDRLAALDAADESAGPADA